MLIVTTHLFYLQARRLEVVRRYHCCLMLHQADSHQPTENCSRTNPSPPDRTLQFWKDATTFHIFLQLLKHRSLGTSQQKAQVHCNY